MKDKVRPVEYSSVLDHTDLQDPAGAPSYKKVECMYFRDIIRSADNK